MRRILPWLVVPLALVFMMVLTHARGDTLLEDTDTIAILQGIERTANPWAWFGGDWPLENHFYRPISTVTFEMDHARGNGANDYGFTNAVLAALGVLALFWLAFELTERPWVAMVASSLFAIWHGVVDLPLSSLLWWVAALCPLGLLRGGKQKIPDVLAAMGAVILLAIWWEPTFPLEYRIIGWIPGRTASTMTIFALIALAAYARFERLSAARGARVRRNTDPPVTRGSSRIVTLGRAQASPWLIVALVGFLLALGSYEQAVMLPGLFMAVAVWFTVQGRRMAWWASGFSWVVLVGYAFLRRAVLPATTSRYQEQQFRDGEGVMRSIWEYLFPPVIEGQRIGIGLEAGAEIFFVPSFWASLAIVVFFPLGLWAAWRTRDRWPVLGTWLMATVAFLPMAWLKHFEHYHQFPLAFRALAAALMLGVAGDALIRAVSLPPLQAPVRPHPAPGSLPRP